MATATYMITVLVSRCAPGRVKALALAWVLLAAPAVARPLCESEATGYLLLDEAGETIDACRAERPLIPASTLKLVTAWLALEHWGDDYRFATDFFLDDDQWLWVRGHGDPMLVSEELKRVAAALAQTGLKSLRGIGIDEQWFAERIDIPGRGDSDNPYDAPVAALAANFNTVIRSSRQPDVALEYSGDSDEGYLHLE